MADPEQNSNSGSTTPSFASLMNKNINSNHKPNFGSIKPNFGSIKPNFGSKTINIDEGSEVKKTTGLSSLSNLINQHKTSSTTSSSVGQSTFSTSGFEQLSAKYLNNNQIKPKFGKQCSPNEQNNQSVDTPDSKAMIGDKSASILCPNFKNISRTDPINISSNEIKPFTKSKDINQDHPMNNFLSRSRRSSSNSDIGSPPATGFLNLTFSPLPAKMQSPKQNIFMPPNSNNGSTPSFSKTLSESPKENQNRFTFDLTNSIITNKNNGNNSPKIKTPGSDKTKPVKQQMIIVDQLDCILDARALLDIEPNDVLKDKSNKRKQLSQMGKVICKTWKEQNHLINFKIDTPFRITPFQFDSMSPDDEIQSKFRRRR